MKTRIAGLCLILMLLAAAGLTAYGLEASAAGREQAYSGTGEPSAKPDFIASLQFDAAMDDHVKLLLTNQGDKSMEIAAGARYMDQLGTAGSWGCSAASAQTVKAGQTVCMEFRISEIVAHGNRSILAFFFQYNGSWYLGKVGDDNGTEYFLQHN